jgi:hypothetical protein
MPIPLTIPIFEDKYTDAAIMGKTNGTIQRSEKPKAAPALA